MVLTSLIVRRKRSWRFRAWVIAAAVVLALPEPASRWASCVGNGSAAHAGERTLDVEAPNFRGEHPRGGDHRRWRPSSACSYLLISRRRAQARETGLRDELRTRDEATAAAPRPE